MLLAPPANSSSITNANCSNTMIDVIMACSPETKPGARKGPLQMLLCSLILLQRPSPGCTALSLVRTKGASVHNLCKQAADCACQPSYMQGSLVRPEEPRRAAHVLL